MLNKCFKSRRVVDNAEKMPITLNWSENRQRFLLSLLEWRWFCGLKMDFCVCVCVLVLFLLNWHQSELIWFRFSRTFYHMGINWTVVRWIKYVVVSISRHSFLLLSNHRVNILLMTFWWSAHTKRQWRECEQINVKLKHIPKSITICICTSAHIFFGWTIEYRSDGEKNILQNECMDGDGRENRLKFWIRCW